MIIHAPALTHARRASLAFGGVGPNKGAMQQRLGGEERRCDLCEGAGRPAPSQLLVPCTGVPHTTGRGSGSPGLPSHKGLYFTKTRQTDFFGCRMHLLPHPQLAQTDSAASGAGSQKEHLIHLQVALLLRTKYDREMETIFVH